MRARTTIAAATAAALLAGTCGAYAAGQITSAQIKNGTITSKDVKNHSLTKQDLKGRFRGRRGPQGPQGPQGAQGPQGPQGPAGPINAAGMTRVESTTTVPAGDIDSAEALCPVGQALVMAQYESTGADSEVYDLSDFGVRDSIVASLDNFDSSVSGDVTAIGYCVPSGRAVVATSRARDRRTLTRRANRAELERLAADRAAH